MGIQSSSMAQGGTRPLDRQVLAMGTVLGFHLEGAGRERLQAASSKLLEEVERIEEACSTRRPDSSWSRLNHARGAAVPMAGEWLRLLAKAQDGHRRTQGAFDPVLLALLRAWGVMEGGRTPMGSALLKARQASGCTLLALDEKAGTARLVHPEAGVEGGGFVKGYALDAAVAIAGEEGVPSGWLDFGGQLLTWGASREVAVADADDRARARIRLRLPQGASLASSGCSERGRHLLDPLTGRACPDWGAVAVVAASGLEAEVLSTALYVKGPLDGPAWAETHGAAAAFLRHGGEVVLSPGFLGLDPVLLGGSGL